MKATPSISRIFPTNSQRLFIRAWMYLLIVDLALRILPFRYVQAWALSYRMRDFALSAVQAERIIAQTGELLARAAQRHLYPMTCLRRSLAIQRLLIRQGIATDLCFGVRRENGSLEAHAWLEYAGQPVCETDAPGERFVRLNAHWKT